MAPLGMGDMAFLGQEELGKPNLRTVGRYTGEKGAPPRVLSKEHTDAKSVPTIPSRFEVTLYKGDREHLGFGSKTMKFEAGLHADVVPGPGQYGRPKAFHEEHQQQPSWGIRGTGGFASRSQRFGSRSMPSLPAPGRGCPGPGAYNPDVSAVKKPKDFNQAKSTSAFALANNAAAVPPTAPPPGPGHYYKAASIASQAAAAQSAFRSGTRRDAGPGSGAPPIGSEDMPGPGEYYEERRWGEDGEGFHTANFKESTEKRIAKVHRDLPAVADRRVRDVLGDFANEVGRECLGTNGLAAALPGPGHYEQDRDSMWEGGLVGANGSSSFQAGQRTNFTSEEQALMPGPGKYNPKKMSYPEIATSAASAFNSVSERNKILFPAAPGPCYYNPSLPKSKRSFQLNARRVFV